MEDHAVRLATIVDARSCASTQVGAEPADGVSIHGAFMDAAEEGGVVDGVKSLGKIHCHRHRPPWGTRLVEPRGYLVNQWQERSGGGASRPEAMLGLGELEVRGDEAEHEPLHHFGCRAEEGDGAVGCSQLLGFTGFEERHDDCVLPHVRDAGLGIGEVEKPAQVAQAEGSKMLQLKHGEAIRAESSGAPTVI